MNHTAAHASRSGSSPSKSQASTWKSEDNSRFPLFISVVSFPPFEKSWKSHFSLHFLTHQVLEDCLAQFPLNRAGVTVCYAVKANNNLSILERLHNSGAFFDIGSSEELRRVVTATKPEVRKSDRTPRFSTTIRGFAELTSREHLSERI